MKKYILLFFALSINVFCYSQINNTFFGLTLGKATKQQVRNVLRQKGYKIFSTPDGAFAVSPNNIPFGGGYWSYIDFAFYNGILYQVCFQNNQYKIPITIDESFDILKRKLIQKYNEYLLYPIGNENTNQFIDFTDKRTFVSLNSKYYNDIKYISIIYYDERLFKKQSKKELDQL